MVEDRWTVDGVTHTPGIDGLLDMCRAAIVDAIGCEDGLDGAVGESVIRAIDEARPIWKASMTAIETAAAQLGCDPDALAEKLPELLRRLIKDRDYLIDLVRGTNDDMRTIAFGTTDPDPFVALARHRRSDSFETASKMRTWAEFDRIPPAKEAE